MALQLTSPYDEFDRLETIEFNYKAKTGQTSKATLSVKLVKYKEINGVFAYSDESPIEFFVRDVFAYINGQADLSNFTAYDSFGTNQSLLIELLQQFKGLAAEVVA